jgi:hypothetical protein
MSLDLSRPLARVFHAVGAAPDAFLRRSDRGLFTGVSAQQRRSLTGANAEVEQPGREPIARDRSCLSSRGFPRGGIPDAEFRNPRSMSCGARPFGGIMISVRRERSGISFRAAQRPD